MVLRSTSALSALLLLLFFFLSAVSVRSIPVTPVTVRQQSGVPAVIIDERPSRAPVATQSNRPTQPALQALQSPPPQPSLSSRPSVNPAPSLPPPGFPTPSSVPAPPGVGGVGGSGLDPAFGSPTPAPPTTTTTGGRGLTTGAIVGIVIGVLVLLALIALLLWFVANRSNDDDNINNNNNTTNTNNNSRSVPPPGGNGNGGAGAAYATPEAGTRSLAGTKAAEGSIQDVNLAEAEADTTGGAGDGYVVSDAARHHSSSGAGAGAGTVAAVGAGALVAESPKEITGVAEPVARAPSPPPHDYVVGVGKIETKSDFEDIKTRFARDEIADKSAVLGGTTHAIVDTPLEGATTTPKDTDINIDIDIEAPAPVVADVKNPVADLAQDRSGDVSEAMRGVGGGVPEIIAEESAETPLFERDELPK